MGSLRDGTRLLRIASQKGHFLWRREKREASEVFKEFPLRPAKKGKNTSDMSNPTSSRGDILSGIEESVLGSI